MKQPPPPPELPGEQSVPVPARPDYDFRTGSKETIYKPQRPGAITFFGVMNLIVGLCYSVCSPIPLVQLLPTVEKTDFMAVIADSTILTVYFVTTIAIQAFLGLMLIVGGIGLLCEQKWGQTLSSFYATFMILLIIVQIIVNLTGIFPTMMSAYIPEGYEIPATIESGAVFGALCSGCCAAWYPALLFKFVNSSQVEVYLDKAYLTV
ncbi:MAG: hypothetical protein RLY93_02490 [Sumerlaeia bacterium]